MRNVVGLITSFFILFLSAHISYADSIDIRPGVWETCGYLEFNGKQGSKSCNIECFKQLHGDGIIFPSENGNNTVSTPDDGCNVVKYTNTGKVVSWEVSCPQDPFGLKTGKIVYKDESFTGSINSTNPANNNTMSTVVNGRFLNDDCSKRDSGEVLRKINPADHGYQRAPSR